MTTITTVGIYLTEDERRLLSNLCNELDAMEESAVRRQEGPESATRAAEQAALRKLMGLPARVGFVPNHAERVVLGRIHDGAPPIHVGDEFRRLVKRILATECPVQSSECAIRGMCTNKCGALDRCESGMKPGTWICPTCGDPKCGEV